MEIFRYLKNLHDECIRLSQNIRLDHKHPRQLYLVGLYGTLIELSGCLIRLIERNLGTGVPPIFRSILEAYVELKNLHAKADYGYHMEAIFEYQWIKILKEAKNKPNPYLKDLSQLEDLDAEIKRHETQLAKLKDKGYVPLNVYERFDRAGMADEYRSFYSYVSNYVHCNIQALVDRHTEIHGNDFSIIYYKEEPLASYLAYIDPTAALLVDASMKIHKFFNTGYWGDVEKLSKNLGEVRSRY